jgi:hypothetical protein
MAFLQCEFSYVIANHPKTGKIYCTGSSSGVSPLYALFDELANYLMQKRISNIAHIEKAFPQNELSSGFASCLKKRKT